jgi:hypothetical protein
VCRGGHEREAWDRDYVLGGTEGFKVKGIQAADVGSLKRGHQLKMKPAASTLWRTSRSQTPVEDSCSRFGAEVAEQGKQICKWICYEWP